MTNLRWGLIGASDIAATRMIPAMRRLGQSVDVVHSSSPQRGQTYADQHDIARHADALQDSFENVDAVYISTTNDLHAAQVRAAFDAGVHVLCEKPLTLDVDEALDLIRVANERGLVFGVNHHLPCAPTIRAVAQAVRSGRLGEVLSVQINHAVYLPERLQGWRLQEVPGAGVILDVTVHDASVIDFLIGRAPSTATGQAVHQGPWAKGAEDAVMSTLAWGDDMIAQTYDAFTVKYGETSLRVVGTEATVTATDPMTQDPIGHVTIHDAQGVRELELPERRDLYDVALEAFDAAIRGTGALAADAVMGTQALATAMAVLESVQTGAQAQVRDVRAALG